MCIGGIQIKLIWTEMHISITNFQENLLDYKEKRKRSRIVVNLEDFLIKDKLQKSDPYIRLTSFSIM